MAEEHDDDEVHAPGPHDDERDAHNPKAVLDPKSADKLNKGHKEEIVLAVIGILIAVYFFFRSSSSGSSSSTTATPVGTAQPVTTGGSGSGSNTLGPLGAEIAKLTHLQTQQANALRTANHNASAAQATTNSEIAKLTAELQKLSHTQSTPATGTGTGYRLPFPMLGGHVPTVPPLRGYGVGTSGVSSKEGSITPGTLIPNPYQGPGSAVYQIDRTVQSMPGFYNPHATVSQTDAINAANAYAAQHGSLAGYTGPT